MDEMQARHREELKDLQGKITQKKKNATKKTRKGVNDECERLEFELRTKHQTEIESLQPFKTEESADSNDLDALANTNGSADFPHQQEGQVTLVSPEEVKSTKDGDSGVSHKKLNRQKARLARRAAEQEAQIKAAEDEAADMPDQRQLELAAMKEQIVKHSLAERVIRPDGHCLYSACADTLGIDKTHAYKELRAATADFIGRHPDDFAPFLEEPLPEYIHKIRETAEWGGHLELQAIANSFDTTINVLQANGQIERIVPENPSERTIWLAYYKHSFGLGEHYNALRKKE